MTSRVAAVAGAALLLSGCVSLKRSPSAHFFYLHPVAEAPSAPGSSPGHIVGVLPVSLPGFLDRPQIVTSDRSGELRVDEFRRWAEPLGDAVTRTLAENLDVLLPGDRAVRWPWPAEAGLDARIRVDLSLFGPQEDGAVRLEGRWAVLPARGERPLTERSVRLSRGPVTVDRTEETVEAMDALLAELAGEIAGAVRAMPPGDAAPPGGSPE
jgi:uncharacterized lipoprotein YmbA